jgi:hypothetical protein
MQLLGRCPKDCWRVAVSHGSKTATRDSQHRSRSDVVLLQKNDSETAVKEAVEGLSKGLSLSGTSLSGNKEAIEDFEAFAKVLFVSGTLLLKGYIGGWSGLCQGHRQEPTPT